MKTTTRAVALTALLFVSFVFSQTVSAQQKKITVNGIPSAHNGAFAFLHLSTDGTTIAWGTATIRSGAASADLKDWVTNQPWNGSGKYSFTFFIYRTEQDFYNQANRTYSGVVVNADITRATTTIQWSALYDVNSSAGVNFSLDGEWGNADRMVRVSGTTAVLVRQGAYGSDVNVDAIKQTYLKIGSPQWRNLKSTGNLTWSGQMLEITWSTSKPNVATGTRWVNFTITMTADGSVIIINGVGWTR